MTADEKNLLLRVARRLEERAGTDYTAALAIAPNVKAVAELRRRRDRELGDARDLREYVKRVESEQAAKVPA